MIILGLHFGHDASVCISVDGKILLAVEIERINRIKHSMGITAEDISLCLSDVGIKIEEIDFCTLTSTQLVEYVFQNKENLSFEVVKHFKHNYPCSFYDSFNVKPEEFVKSQKGWLGVVFSEIPEHPYHKCFPNWQKYLNDKDNLLGGFEKFVQNELWNKARTFREIENTNYRNIIENDNISFGFTYPAVVNLFGNKIPAYIFSHHYAHAAYSFYESPYSEAAIITNDGACPGADDVGYETGLFAYGSGNRLYPLTPNYMVIGELYDRTASQLGFKDLGGAGKLMGLSAYGKPIFFDEKYVGNIFDIDKHNDWLFHCKKMATDMGYDLSLLGAEKHILSPINIDLAASAQKLAEETMLHASRIIKNALKTSEIITNNLCLSGGVALNCPANTRIINEGPFSSIFVPPAVGDGGLSIGSSLALYYNIMGNERKVAAQPSPLIAFTGLIHSDSISAVEEAISEYKNEIQVLKYSNLAEVASNDLFSNRVIAWFEGRSELGPRALGHRSILANPCYKENWERVNLIKSRELWRPFAPMVLEEDAHEFFNNTQLPTYFMLINANVKSSQLPATTHVDGSARVQCVSQECGIIYSVLKQFGTLSGIAVLMNTSFNGPGEPIIETPSQAIKFLISTDLDALFFPCLNLKIMKNCE